MCAICVILNKKVWKLGVGSWPKTFTEGTKPTFYETIRYGT